MSFAPEFLLSALTALLVCAVDVTFRNQGSQHAVLYLWPVWIAARTGSLRWTVCMSAVVSVLAMGVLLFQVQRSDWEPRAWMLVSCWGIVLTVLPLIRAQRLTRESEARLQQMAEQRGEELALVQQQKSTLEMEAEQALRDSEALYHSLVDHLPQAVMRKDRLHRYTFVNRKFLEFSGLSLPKILGHTDYDLFPTEVADRYRAGDEKTLQTGFPIDEVESYRRGDEERWVQVHKSPIYDASRQVVGTQILVSDVTDRRRAEMSLEASARELEAKNLELKRKGDELEEQAELLEAILNSLADGVVVADENGKFLRWNPAAAGIVGLGATPVPREEWAKVYGLYHPDGQTPFTQEQLPLTRAIRGETVENLEILVRNPHRGEPAVISINGRPLRYADGRARGGVVVFRDVTAARRASKEIQAKKEDLETLLYVTSHDLREPLRAIQSFSRLVIERYGDRLDEKGRDFLHRVVRAGERLDHLLQDVLTLSRIERMADPAAQVAAQAVVDDVVRQLDTRIRETHAVVTVQGPLPMLRADRRWATQAVYNLLSNSLKYTRPGVPPEVEVAPWNGPEGQGLVVRDRGPGVPPEFADRIFQLFQRAVGREIEGTGAGLAIVRRVAERHGGKAWVRAREGGGSEFIMTFGAGGRDE